MADNSNYGFTSRVYNILNSINDIVRKHDLTLDDIPISLLWRIIATENLDALDQFCSTGYISVGEVHRYGKTDIGWKGNFSPTPIQNYITWDELAGSAFITKEN